MTMDRFRFQVECAAKYKGVVLNIGCNEDPANLGSYENVLNCDAYPQNDTTGASYPVDKIFDCTEDRWPFNNNSVDLAIFGDIIEHMYPEELDRALAEAGRVALNVCATIPKDERIHDDPDYFEKIVYLPKGAVHVYAYTTEELDTAFDKAGFKIDRLDLVDYVFCPVGYYIEASRK